MMAVGSPAISNTAEQFGFGVSLVLPPWLGAPAKGRTSRRAATPIEDFKDMSELATPSLSILLEDGPNKARYVATVDGQSDEAELTLSKASDSLVIADHTFVPDALRAMGIARALAERLIEDARAKGQRILPLCPFMRAHATKNREALADVIQW